MPRWLSLVIGISINKRQAKMGVGQANDLSSSDKTFDCNQIDCGLYSVEVDM